MVEIVPRDSTTGLLLVLGAALIAAYLLFGRRKNKDGRKLPPTLPSLPVIGSLPFLKTNLPDLAEFFISASKRLGNVFTLHAGNRLVVVLNGWETIHAALVKNSTEFADRPQVYIDKVVNPNAKGVTFRSYDVTLKSQMQLCVSIMKRLGYGHEEMESRIIVEVKDMLRIIREKEGRPFDNTHLLLGCVSNVLLSMLFGRRFEHSDKDFQQAFDDVRTHMSKLSFQFDIFPLLRHLPRYKRNAEVSSNCSRRIIDFLTPNIAYSLQNKPTVESFVSCYVEAQGPDYDQEQLLFTVRQLFIAGTDTTSATLRWAIVLLTNHVAVQERLHAEIDSIIGRERLPTLDDRSRLAYTEATILEIMRHKTVGPFSLLRQTSCDTEVGGYFIPRGTMVIPHLYSAHMDPDDWEQPHQFRPERFLDESGNVINRDRVIPFGLGKRSCLGRELARQEIFLFIVSLLQNFYFKPPEGQDSLDVHEEWSVVNAPSAHEIRMIPRL